MQVLHTIHIEKKYQNTLANVDADVKKTFQYKMSKLLLHVQYEFSKEEMETSVSQEMTVFLFFSIFFIRFAFCEIISLGALLFDYSIKRIVTFSLKRRPIPDSIRIFRYTPVLERLYYISMLINCFSLIFNDDFMEYDLKALYTVFVPTLTEDNMLTFKLVLACGLFTVFLVLTVVFRKIGRLFGESSNL
jgi:hypothetical protein